VRCGNWKVSEKVILEELLQCFNLKEIELQAQMAVLRHCKLVKGWEEDDRIYLVIFK